MLGHLQTVLKEMKQKQHSLDGAYKDKILNFASININQWHYQIVLSVKIIENKNDFDLFLLSNSQKIKFKNTIFRYYFFYNNKIRFAQSHMLTLQYAFSSIEYFNKFFLLFFSLTLIAIRLFNVAVTLSSYSNAKWQNVRQRNVKQRIRNCQTTN